MIMIMSDDLIEKLTNLAIRERMLAADEMLFRREDRVRSLFLVCQGDVRLVRHLSDGAALTLQRAGPGDVLAEASLHAARYHCDAVAAAPSRLAVIPRNMLARKLAGDTAFAEAWARRLAREVQRTRTQIEIMTLKKVDQRLDAWLDLNGGALPAKGNWHVLASEIGVTPEALYRELAKRR